MRGNRLLLRIMLEAGAVAAADDAADHPETAARWFLVFIGMGIFLRSQEQKRWKKRGRRAGGR